MKTVKQNPIFVFNHQQRHYQSPRRAAGALESGSSKADNRAAPPGRCAVGRQPQEFPPQSPTPWVPSEQHLAMGLWTFDSQTQKSLCLIQTKGPLTTASIPRCSRNRASGMEVTFKSSVTHQRCTVASNAGVRMRPVGPGYLRLYLLAKLDVNQPYDSSS